MNHYKSTIKIFITLFILVFTCCTSDVDQENGYEGGILPFDKTIRISTYLSKYKVGETVKFDILGDADSIIVYVGDEGHNYTYKDGQKVDWKYFVNLASRSASSATGVGADGHQKNQLSLLISKDFSGNYTYDDVKSADWKNFDEGLTWAPPLTANYLPSGDSFIESILNQDAEETNIYIAIRHTVLNQEVNGYGALNRVQNVTLKSTYGAGDELVSTHSDMNWQIVSSPNKQPGRVAIESATVLQFRNSWWRASNHPDGIDCFLEHTEDWAISKPITLPRQKELGASTYDIIKSDASEGKVGNYTYVYNTPGEYEAVFIITHNKNTAEEKEEIIKIPVTIIE